MKTSIILIFLIVCLAGRAATTNYCAQTATGNGSGSDIGDCQSLASVNASWTVTAGNTLALVGTFTKELIIAGSGTLGSPIVVYFEPNANFTASYWVPPSGDGGGAISIFGQSFITIDGGQNGIIQATNNGTSLGFQTNCCGIGGMSSSSLTIKNLTIRGMYVRTSNSDESSTGFGFGIQDVNTFTPNFIANFVVSNCIIQDASIGIATDASAGCSNYILTANTISRCNWGASCADRSSSTTMTNFVFSYNNVSNFTNWNDPGNDDYHHNALHVFTANGGTITGIKCFNDTIGPNFGGAFSTSGLFYDDSSGTLAFTWTYNCLFICNTNDSAANGMVTLSGANHQVYNNTFIGGGAGIAIDVGGSTATVENNLGANWATWIANNNSASGNNLVCDYNIGFNSNPSFAYTQSTSGSSSFKTFSQWQGLGYDLHGSTSDPILNSSYFPQIGSSAIGTGANLSSIFTTDFVGNARPATEPWTVGAYQFNLPALIYYSIQTK